MSTVLIVDDDPRMLKVLRDLVQDTEYADEIDVCEQEAAAQEFLKAKRYDIVISDLFLTNPPVVFEGHRVLRFAKEQCPECFTILISAKRLKSDELFNKDVDSFVSFHFENPDYRHQFRQAVEDARELAALSDSEREPIAW
jgi:CheY-like chemotaxis protein